MFHVNDWFVSVVALLGMHCNNVLKTVVWYFEKGGVVLLRGCCGTLKSLVGKT